MSKQEEIREGLQDWIDKYGYSLKPEDIMAWLQSQGVVITDRGRKLVRKDTTDEYLVNFINGYNACVLDCEEEGFVAILPLVGEKNGSPI